MDFFSVARRQIALQRHVGHARVAGHQKARAHCNALRAKGQRRQQAAPIVKTTGSDDGHLHRIDHLRQQHRGGHRAGVTAAFTALDGDGVGTHLNRFLRVFEGADGGHANDASVAQAANYLLVRPPAIADGAQLVLDRQVQQLLGVGLEHVKVQAKRLVVGQLFDAQNFGFDLVGSNGGTSQKAKAAGVGGCRYQRRASHPTHRGLHHWVTAAEQIAQWGAQIMRRRISGGAHALSFLLACTIDLASCPPKWPAPSTWLWAWAKWW